MNSSLHEVGEARQRGWQRFCGLELRVAPGALVPRPETELLAAAALRLLKERDRPRVIDMCCGAGNLACALAHHLPGAQVWAADLEEPCVALARENAAALGLDARVTVAQGDLFAPLGGLGLEGTIDAVVCNPPYISSGRLGADRAALLDLEPRAAFDGGPFGIAIHQRVVREALPFLRPGGWLLCEVGLGQDRQVRQLFARARAYDPIEGEADADGAVRVLLGRRRA